MVPACSIQLYAPLPWTLRSSNCHALVDHGMYYAASNSMLCLLLSPLCLVCLHGRLTHPFRCRLGVFPPESLTQPLQREGRSSKSLYYPGVFLFSYWAILQSSVHVSLYYPRMLLLSASCTVSCCLPLCWSSYHALILKTVSFMLFVSCLFVLQTCRSGWQSINVPWMNEWSGFQQISFYP